MTQYKSQLTEILIDIEDYSNKISNESVETHEIQIFLDEIYEKINTCRVELEEYMRDMLNDMEETYEIKCMMED